MRAALRLCAAALLVLLATACATSPSEPSDDPLSGFTLSGDPASAAGATWTLKARIDGVDYDLQGILLKPASAGPFPAVIISHGASGNVNGYSKTVAWTMVEWGLVCIATNYTHAGSLPIGSPGTPQDAGASTANVLRARRLVDILGHLGYVDMNRVALHGHSMGAFVTAATAGAYPTLFKAASHSAGGMVPNSTVSAVAPTESQIAGIRAPYQMHHGDRDLVVPLVSDQLFSAALLLRGVQHDLIVYSGADHDDVSTNPTVLERVHDWYRAHGMF